MQPFQRILCVLDPHATTQPTLERARLLASAFGARVTLTISVHRPSLNPHVDALAVALSQYEDDIQHALEKFLDREVGSLRSANIEASSTFSWHRSLANSLLAQAEQTGADLIIKDTHYHSAIQRALYTDTDRRLLSGVTVPLWLAREHVVVERGSRLVACVDPVSKIDDPLPIADTILKATALVANQIGGSMDALYVHQPLVDLAEAAAWSIGPSPLAADALLTTVRRAVEDRFDVLCRHHAIDRDRRHFVPGRIDEVLPGTLTNLGASVAVLSRSAPASLDKVLLGSTAERILDHTPCDLLLLPT